MKIIPTSLDGSFVIEPLLFEDERGYFMESYNEKTFFEKTGVSTRFVQDNQSVSHKGVLRGMHYQTGAFSQAKLVRVLQGEVLDVIVDIRPESETYGSSFSIHLSGENKKQLFIPKGFAHGFLTLSESAVFLYKCDNYYNRDSEAGIHFLDPQLAIDWGMRPEEIVVSEKDQQLPFFPKARRIW